MEAFKLEMQEYNFVLAAVDGDGAPNLSCLVEDNSSNAQACELKEP